jgi:polysaccharide biosynthesis protein PslH
LRLFKYHSRPIEVSTRAEGLLFECDVKKVREKVVFLAQENPFAARGGVSLREANVIRALAEIAEVELVYFAGQLGARCQPWSLAPSGVAGFEVVRDRAPLWKHAIDRLQGYIISSYILSSYSQRIEDELRARAAPGKVLWLSTLTMAKYIQIGQRLGYRVVLDEHNLESNLILRLALTSDRGWRLLWHALQSRFYERRSCLSADAVVATSAHDAHILEKLMRKKPVRVLPNTVDFGDYESARMSSLSQKESTLFFAGRLDYPPNSEGLCWFQDEVFPLLRERCGKEMPKIVVAGAAPPPTVLERLRDGGIEVHPNPASILPLLRDATVVMVPLLTGSGTRLKILEAMAAGKPVVSTAKGAEGLEVRSASHLLIADRPEDFAHAVADLLKNPELRARLGAHAAELVREKYDWRALRKGLADLLEWLRAVPKNPQ